MGLKVAIIERMDDGEMKTIDERTWDQHMLSSLHHVNFIMVQDQEYEMIEGRFNVNSSKMEILVSKVKA